jgi:hypothetical protein
MSSELQHVQQNEDAELSLNSNNGINKLPLHSHETTMEGHNNAKRDFRSEGVEPTEEDELNETDGDSNRKKKPRTRKMSETFPTIHGFDLPMDASSTLIAPSKEGTVDFREHDVLSGRGGGTNVHPGNRDFRDLINKYRTIYVKAKKNDKPSISRAIVKEVRSRGGRFLRKNDKDNLYYEIGDANAREKTSQALRQRAPEIRKMMFEHHQFDAASSSGMVGIMGGMGALPSSLEALNGVGTSVGSTTTTTADSGMGHSSHLPEEQFQMAMPLLNGLHPTFAAAPQAGMEFHHPAILSAGGAGQLLGTSSYNPVFHNAMMAGMGGATATAGGVGGGTANGVLDVTAGGTEPQQMGEMGSDNILQSMRHHPQQSYGL